MKIGFVGTGKMGEPMARNLLRAGHEVTVYNRTRQRAEGMKEAGARVAGSPGEAAAGAEVLVSMLADDGVLRAAMDGGAMESLPAGSVHLSMSTISAQLSRELAGAHAARGQGYVAAPVLGRPEAAAERKLWIVAAGPKPELERCRPLLEAMGRGITVAGQEAWKANVYKIGFNFVLISMLESLGESYALVEKWDIDPHDFLTVLKEMFQSPVLAGYGARVADRAYDPPGFLLKWGLKDVQLALEAAREAAVPLPLAGLARDKLLQAIAYGHGETDFAAMAEVARINAGLTKTI